MSTFEVIEYEVWGDEEAGYFVSDTFPTGQYVNLNESELKDSNLLAQALENKVTLLDDAGEITGTSDVNGIIIIRETSTREPLFELRPVNTAFNDLVNELTCAVLKRLDNS
ncbi:MAG: hypothetical protein MN733_05470 [Nitrososphaera sp.]|nr:hypothetical protein [Nitrososphaera sp.]